MLLRQRRQLLVATVTVFLTVEAAFLSPLVTVWRVHGNTAPAIVEISDARDALVAAHRAAIASFKSEESELANSAEKSELTGSRPGEVYQKQIGVANQSLAQAAEDNVAGAEGSRRLQLVESLLVSYTGYIGQASAYYRQENVLLGKVALWNATRLLDSDDGGIYDQLDQLQSSQDNMLLSQMWADGTSPLPVLLAGAAVGLLLILLVRTQFFLYRRFRRYFNPQLAFATLLLIVIAVAMVFAWDPLQGLKNAGTELRKVASTRQSIASDINIDTKLALVDFITSECQKRSTNCDRVDDDPALSAHHNSTVRTADPGKISAENKWLIERIGAAGDHELLAFFVFLAMIATGVLIPYGLNPRIDEYRYQPR